VVVAPLTLDSLKQLGLCFIRRTPNPAASFSAFHLFCSTLGGTTQQLA
jgi:hypothetical protein